MSTKSFERGFTWGGLALALAAALGFAALSSADAGEGVKRSSKIKLVVDRDGEAERVTLVDLHEMEIGETRQLTSDGGRPVTVTRDDQGFEVDVDGKKIRVDERLPGQVPGGEDGNVVRFEKRIVIDGDGENGEPRTMVFHSQDGAPGDVVVMKRSGAHGDGFAWSSNGAELPPIPFGVEGTIERLENNAKFQELDAATRAKVIEALRESQPDRLQLGGPGHKMVVIEVEDESESESE